MPLALSISSHVVHGYVGNRAIVFPLQFCGWDVDVLNTTNYSNHPGYGTFKGSKSTSDQVEDIFEGLHEILDLATYDVIITGYTPSEKVLATVKLHVQQIILNAGENTKKLLWVVDPALGDNGKLYVLETVVPVYRDILTTGLVSLTTPNQFEFEVLSGVQIHSLADVRIAVEKFTSLYPEVPYFVISSFSATDGVSEEAMLYTLGYRRGEIFYFRLNEIECRFNGCGDLFAGLLTAAFHANGGDLSPLVLRKVQHKLHRILVHSLECERELTTAPVEVVKDLRIISLRAVLLEDEEVSEEVKYWR